MKKITIIAGVLALATMLTVPAFAALSGSDRLRRDIVGWGADKTTAPIVGFDTDGDLLPARNFKNDIGESTRSWKQGFFQSLSVASGVAIVVTDYTNLPSSTTIVEANPVEIRIPTSTLLGAPTTYFSAFFSGNHNISSGAPRNIVLYSSVTKIGITTTTLIWSATFYGINNLGQVVVENVRGTTQAVDSSTFPNVIPSHQYDYRGVSNVAWARISSVTVQVTSMTATYGLGDVSDFILRIGYGNKIGLSADVDEQADCHYVSVANGAITDVTNNPLLFINTTFDTIVFPQPVKPNGVNDYTVWCKHMAHHP